MTGWRLVRSLAARLTTAIQCPMLGFIQLSHLNGARNLKLPGQDLRHRGYTMDYLIHIAGPVALVGLAITFHLLVLVWPR